MENQRIIIILLVVIILLLVVFGAIFFVSSAKEDSIVAFDEISIKEGEPLVAVLTDSHGNPIADEELNFKIADDTVRDEAVLTDSEGKAKLDLDAGEYTVECSFKGDNKHDDASVVGTIEVEKATAEVISEDTTVTHTSKYAPDGSIYPEYGPAVDSLGVTREEAKAKNMNYIEMRIDGETVGTYTPYDPVAGCYHT